MRCTAYLLVFMALLLTVMATGQSVDSLSIRAKTYMQSGLYAATFDQYDHCLEIDSLDFNCRISAAQLAQTLGDFKKVKQYLGLNTFVRRYPIDVARVLAYVYETEANAGKAIKYYLVLSEAYPKSGMYHRKLAQQYAKSSESNGARRHYERAYALNSKDVFTIKGLTDLLFKTKEYVLADSILGEAIAYDATNVSLKLQYASSKYRQQAYDSTCVVMKSVLGQVDFTPYYNKLFGYSLLQIDSLDKAIFYLEQALLDTREAEKVHYYLGIAYEQKDEPKLSKFHYQQAIVSGISPDLDTYHLHIAYLAHKSGDEQSNIRHLRNAYEYDPSSSTLFSLARATDEYYADKSIAINYYKKYLTRSDASPQYIKYCKDRIQYLNEVKHQSSKS